MEEKQRNALEQEKKLLAEEKAKFDTDMKDLKKQREELKKAQEKQLLDMEAEKKAIQARLKPDLVKTRVDINLMKPVLARVKARRREITELSQAKFEKIMRGDMVTWFSTPPKMYISTLKMSISNGIGRLSYYLYEMDEKGNKVLEEHKGMRTMADGSKKEITHSANYKFDKLIVETFEYLKPMKREEFKENAI